MNAPRRIDLADVDPAELGAGDADELDIPREKWSGLLAEMVDVLSADAMRNGSDEADAVAAAQHSVLLIAEHFGGRPVYLPRGEKLRRALRDRAIYRQHRGDNADALADRYGLTVRQIQTIYAEQRAIRLRRRQAQLFDDA